MNWLPHIATVVVAVITALASYFGARQKGKADLKKLAESNQAETNRLMQQHEIDIGNLREKHKMELEITTLKHEQNLQLLKAQSEIKNTEQEQAIGTSLISNVANDFLTSLLTNPKEAEEKLAALESLANRYSE
ncbi:MAG: hypothetical protein FWB76_05260 [Oscillospiraceae bacterium]|nr:hypothetical protein [Oscillospiraceae bacterium]